MASNSLLSAPKLVPHSDHFLMSNHNGSDDSF